MNKSIKEVLEILTDNNFEAYLVGGYVRDFIVGKSTLDIDICTSALPKDIVMLFNIKTDTNKYGVVNIKKGNLSFDISTFRKEIKYINRKNIEIEYVNDLKTDILRRDFTINAICMDKDENIIDLLNGKDDIENKLIKLIGNNTKLKDDPLRILRAIRFATILDFKLDKMLEESIYKYKNEVLKLSKTRIREELDKILLSENYEKGLLLLKKFDLLDILGIKYNKVIFADDLYGMYAQIDIDDSYFSNSELDSINNIKNILKLSKIDKYTIFKYGLYASTVASKILGIPLEEITNMYNAVKDFKELDISVMQIKEILDCDFEKAKIVFEMILENVINDKLENKHDKIVDFIKNVGDKYE